MIVRPERNGSPELIVGRDDGRVITTRRRRPNAHSLSFADSSTGFIMQGLQSPRFSNLSEGALLMVRVEKKATQDGTFTVYLDNNAVAWGLTSSAADTLIERLRDSRYL
jgi:hypothetical protein